VNFCLGKGWLFRQKGLEYNQGRLLSTFFRTLTMPIIRIPQEHHGKVWRALVETGPISRNNIDEPIYGVSEKHIRMLRRKKLPFELLTRPNDHTTDRPNG
jgi:hypothetical protein